MTESAPPWFLPATALAAAALLAGCIGPAAPVTANGLVVGAEQLPANIDLEDPVQAVALLAVPRSLTDFESNTVDGASVWIDVETSNSVDLLGEGSGIYSYDPADTVSAEAPLAYVEGATYSLSAEVDGELHTVEMTAPAAPLLEGPEPGTHPTGGALTLDLRGQGFDYATWVVLDRHGEVLLDDRPESAADLMLILRESDGVDEVTVPAGVMVGSMEPYVVAVVGVQKAERSDFDGFGPFWSNFGMGSYSAVDVVTAP